VCIQYHLYFEVDLPYKRYKQLVLCPHPSLSTRSHTQRRVCMRLTLTPTLSGAGNKCLQTTVLTSISKANVSAVVHVLIAHPSWHLGWMSKQVIASYNNTHSLVCTSLVLRLPKPHSDFDQVVSKYVSHCYMPLSLAGYHPSREGLTQCLNRCLPLLQV